MALKIPPLSNGIEENQEGGKPPDILLNDNGKESQSSSSDDKSKWCCCVCQNCNWTNPLDECPKCGHDLCGLCKSAGSSGRSSLRREKSLDEEDN